MRGLVKSAHLAFTRTPRSATGLVHASGTRRAKAVAYRPWLAGSRCGDASPGRRNRRPRVPAGSGDESVHSRARIDGSKGVPARRIRLQKSSSEAEVQTSAISRWQRGAWTGIQPACLCKEAGGCKGIVKRRRGGQAAAPGKARAGRPRGRRGARVLDRWKALQAVPPARSFTRAGGKRPRRPQERR